MTKTALVWKKARGRPSHRTNRQPAAKAGWSVFAESLAELLLIRDISFNIHVEITSDIEVNMSFSKFWILFYLPLRISTWPPQEASNEKYCPNPLSATSVCLVLSRLIISQEMVKTKLSRARHTSFIFVVCKAYWDYAIAQNAATHPGTF